MTSIAGVLAYVFDSLCQLPKSLDLAAGFIIFIGYADRET